MVRCAKCKELKPEGEFSWKFKNKGIRSTKCKECVKAYSREHYVLNRSKYGRSARRNNKRHERELYTHIYNYLTKHACVDCGEADPIVLEFDHVRGLKKFTISHVSRHGVGLATLELEIAKCEIRCRNCHARKHRNNLNHWSYRYGLRERGDFNNEPSVESRTQIES